MHEFRAQLDRHVRPAGTVARMRGEYTSADPMTRLDDGDALAGVRQDAPGGESRHASADDDDVEVQFTLLATCTDPAARLHAAPSVSVRGR